MISGLMIDGFAVFYFVGLGVVGAVGVGFGGLGYVLLVLGCLLGCSACGLRVVVVGCWVWCTGLCWWLVLGLPSGWLVWCACWAWLFTGVVGLLYGVILDLVVGV